MASELRDASEETARLKTRESQLLQELKKRGELARQLMLEKDDEIRNLRQKLRSDANARRHSGSSTMAGAAEQSGDFEEVLTRLHYDCLL